MRGYFVKTVMYGMSLPYWSLQFVTYNITRIRNIKAIDDAPASPRQISIGGIRKLRIYRIDLLRFYKRNSESDSATPDGNSHRIIYRVIFKLIPSNFINVDNNAKTSCYLKRHISVSRRGGGEMGPKIFTELVGRKQAYVGIRNSIYREGVIPAAF